MDRLTALVLLRWRMEIRGILRTRETLLGILLVIPGLLLFATMFALIAYFGVRSLERNDPDLLLPVISAVATAVGLFWGLSPLLAGVAFSESHDMSRLVHFPIPLRTLVASSLIANLAQPVVLAELPVVLSLTTALSARGGTFPLVLVGVAVSFGFILAAAQVIGLLLHGLSRHRRLHDVALFLGLGIGFLLSVAPVLLMTGGARPLAAAARLLVSTDVFALSPFAWGVRAAVFGGRGEVPGFLFYSVAGLASIAGAMAVSGLLIHRIHRTEVVIGTDSRRTGTRRSRMFFAGAVGALAEKDLRVAWRDPALKATLVMGLVGPLVFLFLISQSGGAGFSGTPLLLLACFVGLSGSGGTTFGLERRGLLLLMGFPLPRWKVLVVKNLVALMFRAPGLLTLLVAGLFMAPLSYLPAAVTITLSMLLISSGVDNYMSILYPVVAPAPGRNPYASASGGRGLGAAALGAALLLAALLLGSPFVFLAWLPVLLDLHPLWIGSLPLALAGAACVYALLIAGAERVLVRREPELLERVLGEA